MRLELYLGHSCALSDGKLGRLLPWDPARTRSGRVRFILQQLRSGRADVRQRLLKRFGPGWDSEAYRLLARIKHARGREEGARVDVQGIIQRQWKALDRRYIRRWLGRFSRGLDDPAILERFRQLWAAR